MLSVKRLPHFGTQCFSFTSYLIIIILLYRFFVNLCLHFVQNVQKIVQKISYLKT